jgi:signal peptidase I
MESAVITLRRLLKIFLAAMFISLVVKVALLEAYRIPSDSMRDTLVVGDYLLADKFTYGVSVPFTDLRLPSVREPRVGDVIVFRYPDDLTKRYIKRVIAVGGQVVEIRDKRVLVNGIELREEDYAIHIDAGVLPAHKLQPRDNFGPIRVPEDSYFVLGDNRDNSSDSRYWGCVPRDHVQGRALMIHWSWKPDPYSPRVRASSPLTIVHSLIYNIAHLDDRVRWERLFSSVT